MSIQRIPTGALVVIPAKNGSGFYWAAKFRIAGVQKLRRLGPAWIEARKSEAPDGDGWQKKFRRRRGHIEAGYLTSADAELKMREVIAGEVDAAREMERRKESPSFEFVAELWLNDHGSEADLKGTTRRNYGYMLRRTDAESKPRGRKPKTRIMSAFQGRDIRSITVQDINGFLRGLRSDPELGARSVNVHHTLLNMIFGFAVEQKFCSDNPVAGIKKMREKGPAELVMFTTAQVQAVADEAKTPTLKALIQTAAFSGLRLGELLELRWRDINFEQRFIYVQRSYVAGVGVEKPKSRKGRSVPMTDHAADALREMKRRGVFATRSHDLIFAGPGSTVREVRHLDGDSVSRAYNAARDRAAVKDKSIPELTFHQLRHTFGTMMAAGGVEVTRIQAWMGHSDVKTTMRYMHVAPRHNDADLASAAIAAG